MRSAERWHRLRSRASTSVFFFFFSSRRRHTRSVSAFLLNRSSDLKCDSYLNQSLTNVPSILSHFSSSNASVFDRIRSEERFSRNAETDLVCRLLLEKKKNNSRQPRRLLNNLNHLSTSSKTQLFPVIVKQSV